MKRILLLLSLLFMGMANAQDQRKEVFYFDVDEDKPLPEAFVKLLPELKNARIVSIYGYADSTATTQYNQKLSERRANNVAAYLKVKGILLEGTDIKGFGETQPVGSGLTTDRRVVLTYEKAAAPVVAEKKTDMTEQVSAAKVGDKIRLKNMNFENNSDVMLPTSRPVAYELLKIMKENPKLKIEIQGHICCQQYDTEDIALKRAYMVYTFLVQNGIDKNRLSYKSFGSTRPIHALPEKTEEEKVINRRVEIEILEN